MIASVEHAFEPAALSPRGLRIARAAWIAIVLLTVLAFAIAVPARFRELAVQGVGPDRPMQQLTYDQARMAARLGIDTDAYAVVIVAIEVALALVFIALGVLLFARESRTWLGIYVSLGLITYAGYAVPTLDALLAGPPLAALLSRFVQTIGLQCALTFFFIFPDGRFVPRWTLALAFVWLGVTWSAFLLPGVAWDFLEPWRISPGSFALLMLAWLTGLLAQVIRYRRAPSPIQRQQTKWVLYSVGLAVVGYAVSFAPRLLSPAVRTLAIVDLVNVVIAPFVFYAAILSIPIAMTFSILRYRLWDIDRFIGRTLQYGLTSAALVLIYIGVVLVTISVIRALNPNQPIAAEVIALATVGVAILARPIRDRVQALVDQRFFRAKYDAERTVAQFSKTARETVDLGELTEDLAGVVQTTLHPEHVTVWLRDRSSAPKT